MNDIDMPDTKVFHIKGSDVEYDHSIGNEHCTAGWCSCSDYPQPCIDESCKGLIHADFGDEDSDCNYWLYTQCDTCGVADKA
jgi:hypothetical protein